MVDNTKNPSALQGVRVIDLTRVLAGPFCTMLLGDLGADIIKVEVPGIGDDTRTYPPFIGEESAYFMNLNRNKRSITLNLKDENGKKVFFDLVKASDVVVENFRPGTMDKMGIGYGDIKKVNPGIVCSSISGFGQYGPYKDRPGYDVIGQAMGGIMSVTGWPDSPPTRTGTAIGDILGGLCSTIGILSALMARGNTGRGQQVDVALVDSVVCAMETIIQIGLVDGREPGRVGNRYEFIYPYDSFKASNGWVVIAIGNDKLWKEFCEAIGRIDLRDDPKYEKNVDRVRYNDEVNAVVREWTEGKEVKSIIEFLMSKKIPCAPIYGVSDIINDEHIAGAREMIVDVHHPVAGNMKVVGSPIKLSDTPAQIRTPAPLLGEHTGEILKEVLSYTDAQIKQLAENKVF